MAPAGYFYKVDLEVLAETFVAAEASRAGGCGRCQPGTSAATGASDKGSASIIRLVEGYGFAVSCCLSAVTVSGKIQSAIPLFAAKLQRADEDHAVDVPQGGKDGFARGGV